MSDAKCYRYIKKINNPKTLAPILGPESYLLYRCNNNDYDSCDTKSDIGTSIDNCYFADDINKMISPNKEGYNESLKYKTNVIQGVLKNNNDNISSIEDLSSISDNNSTSSVSSMDDLSSNNTDSTENNTSSSVSSIDGISLKSENISCYKRIEKIENSEKIKDILGEDSFRQYTCISDDISTCSSVSDINSSIISEKCYHKNSLGNVELIYPSKEIYKESNKFKNNIIKGSINKNQEENDKCYRKITKTKDKSGNKLYNIYRCNNNDINSCNINIIKYDKDNCIIKGDKQSIEDIYALGIKKNEEDTLVEGHVDSTITPKLLDDKSISEPNKKIMDKIETKLKDEDKGKEGESISCREIFNCKTSDNKTSVIDDVPDVNKYAKEHKILLETCKGKHVCEKVKKIEKRPDNKQGKDDNIVCREIFNCKTSDNKTSVIDDVPDVNKYAKEHKILLETCKAKHICEKMKSKEIKKEENLIKKETTTETNEDKSIEKAIEKSKDKSIEKAIEKEKSEETEKEIERERDVDYTLERHFNIFSYCTIS